ncbi:MAG: chorismate mutase [Ignavibacteriales bacterium]
MVRGIRGATTVTDNNSQEVLQATRELLIQLVEKNMIDLKDIASVLFTATQDITCVFPAEAARLIGWTNIPLICFQEMNVSGSLPLCVRILMLVNTESNQDDIKHIYLHGASVLREDLK